MWFVILSEEIVFFFFAKGLHVLAYEKRLVLFDVSDIRFVKMKITGGISPATWYLYLLTT